MGEKRDIEENINETVSEGSEDKTQNKNKDNSEKKLLEPFIVFMLGFTALFTAWATWVASLHSGNQTLNYTLSNSYKSEGVAALNEATLQYQKDLQVYTEVVQIVMDAAVETILDDISEEDVALIYEYRLGFILKDNMSDRLLKIVEDGLGNIGSDTYISPFEDEDFVNEYYEEANEILALADEYLEKGNEDGKKADQLGMVTVIYSIVLFLLGIANTFNKKESKYILVTLSVIGFIIGTVIMLSIPLPVGLL